MKQISAFAIVVAGCFIGLATVGSSWIKAFARTEQPLVYAAVYSVLMLASLLLVEQVCARVNRMSWTIAHLALGELSSILAIGASMAAYPDILIRFNKSGSLGNVSDILIPILLSSLLLGGWLLALVGAVAAKMIIRWRGITET